MSELADLVTKLLLQGADPNALQEEFEETVIQHGDWALWGDGRWRLDTVCSKCGSGYAGVCSDVGLDGKHPNIMDDDSLLRHANQLGVRNILRKEWLAQAAGPSGRPA
mgnify:CR=1 FL=1